MKLNFNQASALGCADQSMMTILEAAERHGFDGVDIHAGILDEYLREHSVAELAAWFGSHRLDPASYSAFFFFNWQRTAEQQQAKLDEFAGLIPTLDAIGIKTVALIPSMGIAQHATIPEIRDDAVEMLQKMSALSGPHGIRLALEPIGSPAFTINRFDTAYDIVQAVDRDDVGLSVDMFHFHAMASNPQDLAGSDGRKIFNLDLDDVEDLPVGAPYLTDEKRLWPGDGAIDKRALTDALRSSGFDRERLTTSVEVFRPEYYELSVDENVKTAYEKAQRFLAEYLA